MIKGCPSASVLCAVGSSGVWGKWGSLCPRFHGRLVDLGAGEEGSLLPQLPFLQESPEIQNFWTDLPI